VVDDAAAADDDDDAALPVDVADAAAAARRDGRSRMRLRRLVELGVAAGAADVDTWMTWWKVDLNDLVKSWQQNVIAVIFLVDAKTQPAWHDGRPVLRLDQH